MKKFLIVAVAAFAAPLFSFAQVAPTATISASPATINPGESTVITWSSTDAAACSIASSRYSFAFPVGATAGSMSITPASSVALTLTCSNASGSVMAKASVGVIQPALPAPTASISASSSTINKGDSTTITWSSTNATACWITSSRYSFPFGNGTSGSLSISPASSVALTLVCSNGQTSASAKTVVGVVQPVLPTPTVSLASSLASLVLGQTTTITWSSTNATKCWITSSRGTFPFSNATSGSLDITPSMTTLLTLSCSNGQSSAATSLAIPVL